MRFFWNTYRQSSCWKRDSCSFFTYMHYKDDRFRSFLLLWPPLPISNSLEVMKSHLKRSGPFVKRKQETHTNCAPSTPPSITDKGGIGHFLEIGSLQEFLFLVKMFGSKDVIVIVKTWKFTIIVRIHRWNFEKISRNLDQMIDHGSRQSKIYYLFR